VTSHLIVTFTLALMTFIGINIICIKEHGINMLSLFLPSGSSLFLALLLIPIEIVSYFFRPISLSVRLFANMMAGHTLLKVIIGFAWVMMLAGGGLLVAHTIPLLILVVLMFLELGVACIQAYVFSILVCIYLNDAIHLH
jgi:ATP synthase subunit 6